MIIALDCDGILSDLMPYWLSFYNREYGDSLTARDCLSWDTHTVVRPECGTRIYNYLKEPGFFRNVPLIPGSVDGVRRLCEASHDIVVVTDTPAEGVVDRLAWLREHFPCIPPKNYAITRRKDLIVADLLVDDAPHNILMAKCPAVVFDHPYNQHVPGPRVRDWSQLVEYISNLDASLRATAS